jgi:hypothetical protein
MDIDWAIFWACMGLTWVMADRTGERFKMVGEGLLFCAMFLVIMWMMIGDALWK